MRKLFFKSFVIAAAVISTCSYGSDFQKDFDLRSCKLSTTGKNQYFILEPGHQLHYKNSDTTLQITVLNETKVVDGTLTRVVEEREWKDGKLHEVALNYFAICDKTGDVYYFGENVDYYENDKIVKHDGTWLVGNGNKAGLQMSGSPKIGLKYYQEQAPKIAMDKAEIVSLTEKCKTPAGNFTCMKVKEGSDLEPLVVEYKYYAPNIGLIGDGELTLVKYGFIK